MISTTTPPTSQPTDPHYSNGNSGNCENKKVWRPIWINDDDMNHCLNCNVQFNTIQRRHHCRQCGNIFCNNCSNKRQSLPQLRYDKPVRICTRCSDLANYSKQALSNNPTDRIESAKGLVALTLDQLGKKMIIAHYLDVIYSLLNNFNATVYKHITKAIANLSENEIYRIDIIESNIMESLSTYLVRPQVDNDIVLNITSCFEQLSQEEHSLVKTHIADKCLHIIADLSRSYNNQLRHSSSMVLLNLTKNVVTRELILKEGGVQAFIAMALCDDVSLQIAATEAISILSLNPKYQRKVVEGGALPPLLLMVNSTVDKVLLYTTLSLSSLSENADNQLSIGQVGGVKPMISVLTYTHDPRIPLYAATCLYHLSLCPSNYLLLMHQELFDILSKIIIFNYTNTSHELLQISLKLLGNLSNIKEAKVIIRKNQAIMNILRIMVHSTNKLQSLASVIFNNCESN